MSGDSFTSKNEKDNVDTINDAAVKFDDPWGSASTVLFDRIYQPIRAGNAMENIANDFLDAFKANPQAAMDEWKKIRADIHPGHITLNDLKFIDTVAGYDAPKK